MKTIERVKFYEIFFIQILLAQDKNYKHFILIALVNCVNQSTNKGE